MKKINIILIVIIILILGALAFFGFKLWRQSKPPAQPVKKFELMLITNKGKESEDRDAAMEADVRKIDSAVREYAQDHQGAYPLSDFKNPCRGVRMCLKGVNINSKEKAYLDKIPQIQPSGTDYYYAADNAKKTYCAKTPFVLETANTMVFQCTPDACGQVEFEKACW